uniref:Vacuolar protein sorting-associated protein 13A n=1 Tax=Setaria digitata TaxID=48799 RepID=A0A915Q109_9BILA
MLRDPKSRKFSSLFRLPARDCLHYSEITFINVPELVQMHMNQWEILVKMKPVGRFKCPTLKRSLTGVPFLRETSKKTECLQQPAERPLLQRDEAAHSVMVFESVVAEVLNRVLGNFVNNLDASQLNIGIWGGDVKLTNLEVKETALDDFDLPVKLKIGCLTKLVLKIPWSDLYRQPVIADIEGLNLIVVPNKGVVYNEEKAKKHEKEEKDKALARLEENRKRKRKSPDLVPDTFAEKFIATVIKNLQVTIRDIHIRYEDKYSNRNRPFVVGATLEAIDFKTTDEDWNETIHKEVIKIVYKLVSLKNLAVYWNSDSKLISDLSDNAAALQAMNDAIVIGKKKPIGYKYLLEPINLQAKLALNQKPEADGSNWKIPKIKLILDLDVLAIAFCKFQYQDLLLLLEAQERFRTAAQYLKYRPNLNDYKGHYKEWWHFAYNAIVEESVRRRRNNWNWEKMKKHRKSLRDYKDAWLRKQTEKTLSSKDQNIIQVAEMHLDVFNLNVARQQADMEIDRRGLKRLEDQPQGWIGWAKSWWNGGGDAKGKGGSTALSSGDIMTKFEEALTAEEKAKLFDAIDYQENTPPTDYPKHFVENIVIANLNLLMIVIEDALTLKLSVITTRIEHRASAQAVKLRSGIKMVGMDGCGQQVLFMQDESVNWLTVLVDTNPLDRDKAGYDQYLKVALAPTVMKYHAPAINTVIEALRPPESVRLNQLTAAAMARYEDVKSRSLTGLAHVVDTRTKLMLDIRIAPLTVVISENGIFGEKKKNLIADLGLLTVTTIENNPFTEKPLLSDQETDRRTELLNRAYDKFSVKLTDMQLIFSDSYQSGMNAKLEPKSDFHLLQPTGLNVAFHKSSIDDLQLPKMKIMGELPDIIIAISDVRLLELIKLILSIPTPAPEKEIDALGTTPPVEFEKARIKDLAKIHAIMEANEISETEESLRVQKKGSEKLEEKKADVQQIQVDLNFTLPKELVESVLQVEIVIGTPDTVFLSIQIKSLGCGLQMRTFDMVAVAYLGDLTFEQPQYKSLIPGRDTLFVIDSTRSNDRNLLQLKYIQANKESPFFATEYKSTEQTIDISFKTMIVSLHQDALIGLKRYFEALQAKIAELQKQDKRMQGQGGAGVLFVDAAVPVEKKMLLSRSSSQQSVAKPSASESLKLSHARRERQLAQTRNDLIVKLHVNVVFDALSVYVGSTKCLDTALSISVVQVAITMRVRTMEIEGGVKMIAMEDRTETTVHTHLLALCDEENEMLSFSLKQYNRTEAEREHMQPSDLDFFIKCRFARLRFVLLFLWLERMKRFALPFQLEAAQVAAQAQSYASEKASQAAQRFKHLMEESPLKIGLDIELAAPTILVPKNSMSLNAIFIDFGKLTAVNAVSAAQHERRAIIDSMQIILTDVCFGIALLSEDCEVLSTCQILKPVTFSLLIYRNLSFDWYRTAPQTLLDAHLPIIEMGMTEEDYATLLKTLSGNLAEGNQLSPEFSPSLNPSIRREKSVAEKRQESQESIERAPSESSRSSLNDSVAKSLVFSFKLDEVAALLYRGSSNLENSKGEIARKKTAGFASVRLKKIKLSGSKAENGELDVAVSLEVFVMEDERSKRTETRRLLDKKADSAGKIHQEFVAARYQASEAGDKIRALVNFFTVKKTPEELVREVEKVNIPNIAHNKEKTETIPSAVTMKMNCTMHEAEILLVEDALNPENSQALVLSFNVDLKVEPDSAKQVMVGGIRNLQIISTYYLKSKRDKIPYQVLKRTDIDIRLTMEQKTMSENFVIHIGQLYLKISPAIIRLLSAVSSNFLSATNVNEDSLTARKPVLKKYPNYWEKRKIDKNKHWWFNVPEAEQEDYECAVDVVATVGHEQQGIITMGSLIVTLEAGVSNRTVPMVLLESSAKIAASQWSTLLAVDADLQFQISYYNETFCVWEPIVEPVEVGDNVWRSWVLKAELRTHGEDELTLNGASPLPQRTIDMKATEMLNITITKSLILLSYQLMDSFERAAKLISPPVGRTFPGSSKYLIFNSTGISVKVGNTETMIVSVAGQPVDATPCTFVDLNVPVDPNEKIGLTESQMTKKAELRLIFDELNTERYINVMRSESRTFELPMKSDDGKQWKVVVETKVENLRQLIYVHSTVQFVNHLDIPFEIYSMRNGRLDFCGIAETDGEPLDIALPLLYTATGELFIKPQDDTYEMSNESICWNKFNDKTRYIVRCDLSEDMKQGLFVALVIEEVLLKAERSRNLDDSCYIVHIFSPLTLHNFLPFPVRLISPVQKSLSGGEEVSLNVIPGQNLSFENLGVHWTVGHRKLDAELYAPYWFVNNTGRIVRFVCDDAIMQEPFSEPALLPLDAKDFLSKKKAKLSLFGSYWTNEFPLDAVGNAGRISCKDETGSEQNISLQINMCQSGLTKVITFLPFYLLHNESKFPLEVREFGAQAWIPVAPQTCIGFWPSQNENRKYAVVRYSDTIEESILFPITETFEGFCHIDNDYLGVYVTVAVSESSSLVKFESFEPGMAPAIIMNATKKPVEFSQKGARLKKTLGPWESCAFTWIDVIRDRELEWKSGDASGSDDLIRNTFEDYKISKSDSTHYYWVSFLNGRQRVYLFTDDLAVMTTAHEAYEIELPTLSIEMSLQGIGISIVDNFKTEEIAYMCIASSAIIWEQFVKTRFKPFTVKQMEAIEHAYQAWLSDRSGEIVVVDKLELDFINMKLKKQKDKVDIRRQFQIGLWMQYRQTPHQLQFHMKLNHLQIDNQLPACVFPCVLSLVPPPKSVVQDSAPKSFCELSYIKRESEHSRIAQIKYLHLLVQEFAVQVDQGFVNAILELTSSQADSKPYTKEAFVKDFEMTKNQLLMIAGMTTASQQTAYYENLHISPLMIHLSFSQGGSSGGKQLQAKIPNSNEAMQLPPIQSEFVNVFLKSVGITVTEIQDVVFKLAFFERKYAFYTTSQLQGEVIGHYMSQIIKQLYVLVLGLDILGNPFGLVRDLSSGVQDFFYQPFQGAVQGPEEFAEGVALGVKGLFGATVGGGAGAVSRIAGTLGKGVAALTLDEDYQRKRQQVMNRRPKTISEGVARGAKGVGQGFYEGIAGVVFKPLAGARTGGAGGFAKGLSLGLVGIVTRPLSGAVDFASSTLDAVRSATVGTDEMKPLRPPRVIFSDNIVRPYSQKAAAGAQIFREADHGSVADTDYFLAHAPISEKSLFIITDRRAMNVKKSDMVGSWNIEWQILYTEMNRPTLSGKTILIDLRKKQKGFLRFSSLGGRVVELIEQTSASEIYNKLLLAYETEVGSG